MDKIPLAQLIELVTDELRRAESLASQREDHIMQFEECELEMGIEVEASAQGEGNVWVFKLGGGVKKTDVNTIRVKFKRLSGVDMAFPAESEGYGPELG
jgi:hypothetical protein